ncbi:MgtC/SapB family protein [Kitasatospora sp. NPDC056138]|uniref:MgtC/SapB family protein n=1 Tax=Kitasatospora sp. NPDC056138 TaxID=3345724 RepID=UPI0035E1B0C0
MARPDGRAAHRRPGRRRATLFVLCSEAVSDTGSPTRVASYVVSGVGFLSGGVILRAGASVRGLNTAAILWCSAAVGVLAASGKLELAALGSLTVLAVHLVLRPAARLLDHAPAADTDPDSTTHGHNASWIADHLVLRFPIAHTLVKAAQQHARQRPRTPGDGP